ncbi:MAG: 4Fe-4S binding protein, partial [Cyclobacteriaceae bacterium]|nr:4Fe-4S binding protein [Cyclobacteriaceae bacterium]
DDQILSPTPAQEIVFGHKRRVVPAWYQPDNPGLLGGRKEPLAGHLGQAARGAYYEAHLPSLIARAFKEFGDLTGRYYHGIAVTGEAKNDRAVLLFSNAYKAFEKYERDPVNKGDRVALVKLNVLQPFPLKEVKELIEKKKFVSLVSPLSSGDYLKEKVVLAQEGSKSKAAIIEVKYGPAIQPGEAALVLENMAANSPKKSLFPGVEYYREDSLFPKQQVLMQTLKREYPHLHNTGVVENVNPGKVSMKKVLLPQWVKRYKDQGQPFTRLSGFLDHTSLFYEQNAVERPIAHPFQTLPVPPASALLRRPEEVPAIPEFLPGNCTACGDCFTSCPHAALPPLVITVEHLLRAGMSLATERGHVILAMTPHVKGLAKISSGIIAKREQPPVSPADFLPEAFETFTTKMELEGEKLQALTKEFEVISEAVRSLPVAITEITWKEAESYQKGSGGLFTLAVDLASCTGCGRCEAACGEGAILMKAPDETLLSATESNFRLWECLPDTPADIINDLLQKDHYDPFSALFLSRNFYFGLAGSTDEAYSDMKTIVRMITAVTESVIQPRYAAFSSALEEQIEKLSGNIRTTISEALPRENFNAVLNVLKDKSHAITINDLLTGLKETENLRQMDPAVINRKINLLNDLKALKWEIDEGPTGQGRARYGLVVADDKRLSWSSTFPDNPFTVPVLVSSAPETALGLSEGLTRHWLDNIRLTRRAMLEVKDQYNPDLHDEEIAALSWDVLSKEEVALIPPILLLGSEGIVESLSPGVLAGKPIKVIALDTLSSDPVQPRQAETYTSVILQLASARSAYIFQGGLHAPRDVFNALAKAITSSKSAFLRIFTPVKYLYKPLLYHPRTLPLLATITRAFPSYTFDPERPGTGLSTASSLDGNTSVDETWHSDYLSWKEGEETRKAAYKTTWADWAFLTKSWQDHFTEYTGEEEKAMPLADYLEKRVNDKEPVILRVREGRLVRYRVSRLVVDTTERVMNAWNLLREISGALTLYPEKLREEVKGEIAKDYEEKLAALKAEYEAKLETKGREQMEIARQQLKSRLLQLSGIYKSRN